MLPTFGVGSNSQNERQSITSTISQYGSICWNRMWPYVNSVLSCMRGIDKVFSQKDKDLEDWVLVPVDSSQQMENSWTEVIGSENEGTSRPSPIGGESNAPSTIQAARDRPMVDVDLSASPEFPIEFD